MADQQQPRLTPQEEEQLQSLEKALGPGGTAALAIDPCEYWKQVKPYWGLIIRLVRWIPKYGEIIAKALEKLRDILDKLCPPE